MRYHARGSANANGDDYDLSGHVSLERSCDDYASFTVGVGCGDLDSTRCASKWGQDDGYVFRVARSTASCP